MARKTIRENVEWVLGQSHKARNDDKALLLLYWKHFDKVDIRSENFPEQFIKKATPAESITRARRLIQQDGLYLPDVKVAEARKMKEADMTYHVLHGKEVV